MNANRVAVQLIGLLDKQFLPWFSMSAAYPGFPQVLQNPGI